MLFRSPAKIKTEALLRAYGRFVQSLHGRYYTACDVGTFSEDMDQVARECSFVTGRTVAHGGAGDSSVLTAFGVFQGMRAAAETIWGAPTLADRTVGVAGVGKVGHHLVDHLVEDGANVVVTDVNPTAVARVLARHPDARVVADADALVAEELDVYAPCALGGALDDAVVETLSAKIVAGAANNQLAHDGIEKQLQDRGILYATDYMVNAGGLIQVADELEGFSFDRAKQRAEKIFDTTGQVFALAAEEGVPPAVAADRLAERRMLEVGRLRGIWLGLPDRWADRTVADRPAANRPVPAHKTARPRGDAAQVSAQNRLVSGRRSIGVTSVATRLRVVGPFVVLVRLDVLVAGGVL